MSTTRTFVPADKETRAKARAADVGLSLAAMSPLLWHQWQVAQWLADPWAPMPSQAPLVIGSLLSLGLSGLMVFTVVSRGQTLGQIWTQTRNVDTRTGDPAGPRALGKYVVQSLTLGLAPLISWLTLREGLNQTAFDRMFDITVADVDPVQPAERSPGSHANVASNRLIEGVSPGPHAASADWPGPSTAPIPVSSVSAPVASPDLVEPIHVAPDPGTSDSVEPVVEDHTVMSADMAPSTFASIVLDDGRRFMVEGTLVIGRDPSCPDDVPGASTLGIEDPSRSISKTHLAIGPSESGIWVMDLHSTNGVSVAGRRLAPLTRDSVPVGGRVLMGTRFFEVTR